uniref:Transmembrane protein 248-like n=1 Tax=Ciona intestinalis TaxID=7719 RepID=F6V184_CIOIN|nr:transmembrane protein 248-like [Ciona intestinalis]|eukprot:XP_002129425.1 transmembrane protein 248-like [Ciona intestinalis]
MVFCKAVENVRSCLSTRPPLVVFVFCIGMITVAFISFAYYIRFNEIRDPNVYLDWNTYLDNLSKINFCSKWGENSSRAEVESYNISIPMMTVVSMTQQFPAITHMFSVMNGTSLGLGDGFSLKNISVSFQPTVDLHKLCRGEYPCTKVVPACVTIAGPVGSFPNQRHPLTCNNTHSGEGGRLISFLNQPQNCSFLLNTLHKEDEKLYFMVSMDQKTVVHNHLMLSSYFFIIVIFTMVLYGALKGGVKR